ncbi:hypothetical protein ACU8V3_14850 [Cobetia marina]
MLHVIHCLEGIIERLGIIARYSLLALVVLVASNVLLRYFFSISPVPLQEFEWHLISPSRCWAFPMPSSIAPTFASMSSMIDFPQGACAGGSARRPDDHRHRHGHCLARPELYRAVVSADGRLTRPGGLPYRYLLKAFIPIGFAALALQGVADSCAPC